MEHVLQVAQTFTAEIWDERCRKLDLFAVSLSGIKASPSCEAGVCYSVDFTKKIIKAVFTLLLNVSEVILNMRFITNVYCQYQTSPLSLTQICFNRNPATYNFRTLIWFVVKILLLNSFLLCLLG